MPSKPRSSLFDDAQPTRKGRSSADPNFGRSSGTCAPINLPGRFDAYFAETRHSANDPIAVVRCCYAQRSDTDNATRLFTATGIMELTSLVFALINEPKVHGKKTCSIVLMKGDNEQLIEVEDSTPDDGMRVNHGRALVSGRRVKADYVPKQMRLERDGVIPDYGRSYGLFHATDKFKDVVEAIEPDLHQFIPFELVGPRKKYVADLWFMFVCNRLDTVDRERTTLVLVDGKMWLPAREAPRDQWPSHVDSGSQSMLFFDLNRIGDHHLWFDKHIIQELPLVSEKLASSLKDAGVTGVAFSERRVAK